MKILFTKTCFVLVLVLLMGSNAFAQNPDPYLLDDFESGDIGWKWNGPDAPEITANPDKSGINLSDYVMYATRDENNVPWAGPKIDDAEQGTVFADTWGEPISGYNYLHIKMNCNKETLPRVVVEKGGPEPDPVAGTVITPYTWVDVVFDITGSTVDCMIIMIDWSDPLTETAEVYLDDIILTNDPNPRTMGQTPDIDPYLLDDFESGDIGWNWNGPVAPEITANPDQSGINRSDYVMYATRDENNVPWAGPKIDDSEMGNTFATTWGAPISGYNYMHIKMYANKEILPRVVVEKGGPEPDPIDGTVITPFTWVDVVFDISGSTVNCIIIMIDWSDPLTETAEVYLDDIILTNNPSPRTTGIKNVTGSDVTVFAVNGILHISGSSDAVAVYNALGQTVYQNTSAENISVELANGMYIVKTGATTKKVLVQ